MIRYKSFYFPAKYKKLSKEELFIEFLNKNIFLWKTPALYSKKIFEILKDEVIEVKCEYCNSIYQITHKEIEEFIKANVED